MQILSNKTSMIAIAGDYTVRWVKGSHTANVFLGGSEVDVFTFAWCKDKASQLDFTTSLLNYLEYQDETAA